MADWINDYIFEEVHLLYSVLHTRLVIYIRTDWWEICQTISGCCRRHHMWTLHDNQSKNKCDRKGLLFSFLPDMKT